MRDSDLSIGVRERLRELLAEHLGHYEPSEGEKAWYYLNRLADQFPDMSFWAARSRMIPLYRLGQRSLVSFQDLEAEPVLTEVTRSNIDMSRYLEETDFQELEDLSSLAAVLIYEDFRYLYEGFIRNMGRGRKPTTCRRIGDKYFATEWRKDQIIEKRNDDKRRLSRWESQIVPCQIEDLTIAAVCPERPHPADRIVLINAGHVFGKWFLRVREAYRTSAEKVEIQRLETLSEVIYQAAQYNYEFELLRKNVIGWRAIEHLPAELKPPEIEVTSALLGGDGK